MPIALAGYSLNVRIWEGGVAVVLLAGVWLMRANADHLSTRGTIIGGLALAAVVTASAVLVRIHSRS